jgi:Protein of unknown function (DUF4238)
VSHPINHHYLPVFYLSQWCTTDGKVIRYYRPHKDVVASPIAPDNTGYEPGLYTLFGYPSEKAQVIETEFMGPHIDEPASRALKVLIADVSRMTDELRVAWTRFLMSMRLREPHSLAEHGSLARNMLRNDLMADPQYLALRKETDPPSGYEWIEEHRPEFIENIGKLFLPRLIDHKKIGEHIINMHWVRIDLSASNVSLLTGDRPFIHTHRLRDVRCILAFPLSTRFLFIGVNDPQLVEQLHDRGVTRIAKAANANIVGQAIKHVYGNSGSHRQFVERLLRR